MPKKAGRRKGGRNKGYFFRTGRGWFAVDEGQFVPLTDEDGNRLRERDAQGLEEAYARHLLSRGKPRSTSPDVQVGVVCAKYLDHLKGQFETVGTDPQGVARTYRDRGKTLFDFCEGLPGSFFCDGDKEKRKLKGNPEKKRIHDGYGMLATSDLTPGHVDEWLASHKKWKAGGRRTRLQALKRAFNFAVERKLIPASPLKGYKIPKAVSRVTYLTPGQEVAMIAASTKAFGEALYICIRTGARFGSEFARIERRHVVDHGNRMEWKFRAEESKNKKPRAILVTDPKIIAIVRRQIHLAGPIFRNQQGNLWDPHMLSQNFRRVKTKIGKTGVVLDDDACMYSCRHTYAKRVLEGHWTGKPTSIKTLARLMGNTVQVCIDHYLQFSEADNEMLWEAV